MFEVLSKSTAWIDQTLKLRASATPSICLYALISQDDARALVYRRDGIGRLSIPGAELLESMDEAILVPDLDITLPLASLCEGLDF